MLDMCHIQDYEEVNLKQKSICILLPGENISPVGGYKVTYQYANALSQNGYIVTIVHSVLPSKGLSTTIPRPLRMGLWIVGQLQRMGCLHQKWFPLNQQIKSLNLTHITKENLPKADIYIATAVMTAYSIQRFAATSAVKYYFIQGYECWDVAEDFLLSTYHYPMHKIAISPWLMEKIAAEGEQATYIPNGIDTEEFGLDILPNQREPKSILFMSSSLRIKGTSDAIAALEVVHAKYPDIHVCSFGTCMRPSKLPKWISYYRSPTKKQLRLLYNKAAIFLGTSWTEGFGLTIAEAMACGCAVICTRNGGYQAISHEDNSCIVPIQRPDLLAEQVIRLLEFPMFRIQLAEAGIRTILQDFSLEKAQTTFVEYIGRTAR